MRLNHDLSEIVNYPVPQFPMHIKRCALSSYHNYTGVSHWHEDAELIYVLSGYMQYDINGQEVIIHENESLFVNSRNFHYGYSDTKEECEYLCILIHPSLFSGNDFLQENCIKPFLECIDLPYIHLKDESWHKKIIRDITSLTILSSGQYTSYLQNQFIISHIISILYENNESTILKSSNRINPDLIQLRKMADYVQKHYHEDMSLRDIADIGKMGKTCCIRIFKQYMHTTPVEYLLTYRITQSASLLTSTTKSITEIAYEVGFHDSSYYTKSFKKYYGCTPKVFRTCPNSQSTYIEPS